MGYLLIHTRRKKRKEISSHVNNCLGEDKNNAKTQPPRKKNPDQIKVTEAD